MKWYVFLFIQFMYQIENLKTLNIPTMQISLSVIIDPLYLQFLYKTKMVLFTSSFLPSETYPSSVLSDLKSQHLSAQDNVVLLCSDNQNVFVHTFVLRNVSILLFNLLEFSSVILV